ncbi:DENN domain-containing protein 1A-like isoform X2 [Tubulanus polymorphus]|uniref:DENN domain-containing protein 1A-like isoform X2 n=1 Tax=Tubulanus polymorphus TaxID=672921 RepID=UPI003DA3A4B2
MGSRIKENPDKIFEVFAEVGRPSVPDGEPFILQKFPEEYDDEVVLKTIPEFTFPCAFECQNVDHFTFVLTDVESKLKFGFCRYTTGANTCLCIVSFLPWYEVFYKLLNALAEILNKTDHNNVSPLLKSIHDLFVPTSHDGKVEVISSCCTQHFSFTAPDPTKLPKIPDSRNLTEYYTAVDPYNMMVIFASMLYERRILITSQRLSRLTACVHGSAALIYPMHWQHLYIPVLPVHLIDYVSAPMPFIIGIHSTLMQKACKMELGDAVVLDADNNTVTSEYDDLETLPPEIVSALKKSLKGQQTDKIKNQTTLCGDGVARAFLRALVALIGGYRDALKFREGEEITFDRDAFLQSRPPSMQPFLEKILDLQIFEQFISDRLSILNSGHGFTADEFEIEANTWQDKSGSMQSLYKDWYTNMKKQGKKIKQESKDKWVEFTSKVKSFATCSYGCSSGPRRRVANPAVKSAVKTVKSKGKKAVRGLRLKIEDLRKDDDNFRLFQSSSSIGHKPLGRSSTLDRPITVYSEPLKMQRPPRPPPQERPRTAFIGPQTSASMNVVAKSRQYKLISMDDMDIKADSNRISVGLMNDPDIQQALKKSYSMEDMLDAEDDDDSSSVFGSEDSTSVAAAVVSTASPVAPPRRHKKLSQVDKNESSAGVLTADDKVELRVKVPPPLPKPRTHKPLQMQKDAASLIKFDSDASLMNNSENNQNTAKQWTQFDNFDLGSANEAFSLAGCSDERDKSSSSLESSLEIAAKQQQQNDHYGNVHKLKEVYLGYEDEDEVEMLGCLHRRQSSIKRSPAFKIPAESRPAPRKASIESDFFEFDPLLVNKQETSSTDSNKSKQLEDEENLLKDWNLNFSTTLKNASLTRNVAAAPSAVGYQNYPAGMSGRPVMNYPMIPGGQQQFASGGQTGQNINNPFSTSPFAPSQQFIQSSPSATPILKPRQSPVIQVSSSRSTVLESSSVNDSILDPFGSIPMSSSNTTSSRSSPKWETFE